MLGILPLSDVYDRNTAFWKRQKLFLQTFHENLPSANMSGKLVSCCQQLPTHWQVPISLHPQTSAKSQNEIVARMENRGMKILLF